MFFKVKIISGILLWFSILFINTFISMASDDLFEAIESGDIAAVKEILDKNPELIEIKNKDGQTPFLHSILCDQLKIAELLLSRGADINSRNGEGETSLHLSALYNKKEWVEFLLKNGADVNMKTANEYGITPVFFAARNSYVDIVELLVSNGADVTIPTDNMRTTALHIAVAGYRIAPAIYIQGDDKLATMQLLLDNGADVNFINKKGETPLDSVYSTQDMNVDEFKKILINYGAISGNPILRTYPLEREKDISTTDKVKVFFSGERNPSDYTFFFNPSVSGTVSSYENSIIFTPDKTLKNNTLYEVTFRSKTGNIDFSWTFTTK